MTRPTAVRVHNNLSTRESGVPLRSSDGELARGVDVILNVVVEEFLGNRGHDRVFDDPFANDVLVDVGIVLRGDDDRVDAHGSFSVVFEGDLALGVGTEPIDGFFESQVGEFTHDAMRERDRKGHELRRLIAGVAEHDSLIPRADVFRVGGVDSLGDIGALLVERDHDGARGGVNSEFVVGVSDASNSGTHDVLIVELGFC